LTLADYDLDTGRLRVLHGKGNQQRLVYVKGGAQRALAAWLECRGVEAGALVMPVNKAGKVEHRGMTDQAVYNLLLRRGDEAGLKHFSPHDFRRTFVGDLLDRGADIVTVQHLAGHATPNTTARYDRRPEKVKEDAASKLHFPF
jgi:integrase